MKLLIVACIAAIVGYACNCDKTIKMSVPKQPAKYPSSQSNKRKVVIEYRNLLLATKDNKTVVYKHRILQI